MEQLDASRYDDLFYKPIKRICDVKAECPPNIVDEIRASGSVSIAREPQSRHVLVQTEDGTVYRIADYVLVDSEALQAALWQARDKSGSVAARQNAQEYRKGE